MNISVNNILDKMTQELVKAKQETNHQKVRESVVAIRTLCDLILEESSGGRTLHAEEVRITNQRLPQPLMTTKETKLVEEDGNGDSLLDF